MSEIFAGDAEAIALRVVEGEEVTMDEVRILAAFVLTKDADTPDDDGMELAV